MNNGWIKLHRQIKEHWLWKDPIRLQWWLIVILEVNFKPGKMKLGNKIIRIDRGASSHSLRTWANLFGCGTKATTNFFDLLENDQMITRKTIGKGKHSTTLINVSNYEQYQSIEETLTATLNDTQEKHKRDTIEERKEELKKKELYTEQKFLERWKKAKMHYDKKPTFITKLKHHSSIKFKELLKTYSPMDFDYAIKGLFEQNTYPQTRIQPDHFLENFEQYLTCGQTGEKLFDQKKKNGSTYNVPIG